MLDPNVDHITKKIPSLEPPWFPSETVGFTWKELGFQVLEEASFSEKDIFFPTNTVGVVRLLIPENYQVVTSQVNPCWLYLQKGDKSIVEICRGRDYQRLTFVAYISEEQK